MRKSLQAGHGELTNTTVGMLYMTRYISPRAGEIYRSKDVSGNSSESAQVWIGTMVHDAIRHILTKNMPINVVNDKGTHFTPEFQQMVGEMFIDGGNLGEEFWGEVFGSWREYIKRPWKLDELYIKHIEILDGVPRFSKLVTKDTPQ